MRRAQADEVRALGYEPGEAVELSLMRSAEAWSLWLGDRLACLFGVVRVSSSILGRQRGAAWLLATDAVDAHPKSFWLASRAVLPQLLERWASLFSTVDGRRKEALRWGRRLGFEFRDPVPLGVNGELFHPFTITAEGYRWHLQQSRQLSRSQPPQRAP